MICFLIKGERKNMNNFFFMSIKNINNKFYVDYLNKNNF